MERADPGRRKSAERRKGVQEFREIRDKPGRGFKVNLFVIPKKGGKARSYSDGTSDLSRG
jgi:hypothetical protein